MIFANSITDIPANIRVFIYGTGEYGSEVRSILEKDAGIEVLAFVDSFKSGTFEGLNVIRTTDLSECMNSVDYVVTASAFWPQMIDTLTSMGIENVIVCNNQIFSELFTERKHGELDAFIEEHNKAQLELAHKATPPARFTVQTTNDCNLRCKMCHLRYNKRYEPDYMSLEFFQDFLDQAKNLGVSSIAFGAIQGEPFMHPQCLEFLQASSNMGFAASITTNVNALSLEDVDALLDIDLSEIVVSFAGYDRKSYESIYCGAKFDWTNTVLKHFVRRSAEIGKPDVFRVFGVAQGNVDNSHVSFITKTFKHLKSLGISHDKVVISRARNFGGSVREGILSEKHGVRSFMPVDLMPQRLFCNILSERSPWGLLSDGRITACGCDDGLGRLIVGNIKERSLADIAKNNPLEEWTKQFLGDMAPDHPCVLCDTPYSPVNLRQLIQRRKD